MKITFSFYALILLMLLNCKSQQFTSDNLPLKRLTFGSGGGMSGASDTYILLENGQLFHKNSLTNDMEELSSLPKAKAREYFISIGKPSFSGLEFDYPGNIYYFLEIPNGDAQNRIVWGSTEKNVPRQCKALYQDLVAHLNK